MNRVCSHPLFFLPPTHFAFPHSTPQYLCVFCGAQSVKRKATGIWNCGKCKKTQTGGAYILRCVGDSLGSFLQSTPWSALPHEPPQSLTSHTHSTLPFFFLYSTAAAATVRSNLARMRKDE